MDNMKTWAAKMAFAGMPAPTTPPRVRTSPAPAPPASAGAPALGSEVENSATAASRAMRPSSKSDAIPGTKIAMDKVAFGSVGGPLPPKPKPKPKKLKRAPRYSAGGKAGKKPMPMPHANQLKKPPGMMKAGHIAWAEKIAAYDGMETGPYSGQQGAMVSALDKSIAGTEYAAEKNPAHHWLNPFVRGPIAQALMKYQRPYEAGKGRNYTGAALGTALPPIGGAIGDSTGIPILGTMGQLAGMGPSALMGGAEVRDDARVAHEDVNMSYHEGKEDAAGVEHDEETKRKREAGKKIDKDERDSEKEPPREKAAKIGPYDVQQASDVAYHDDRIAGLERNRNENPLSYWLNPFVGGPIDEGFSRIARRANAGTVENWPGAIGGAMTGGILPAILGGRDAKHKARQIYQQHGAEFDTQPQQDEDAALAAEERRTKAQTGKNEDDQEKAAAFVARLLNAA